jgi:hypothetical protein
MLVGGKVVEAGLLLTALGGRPVDPDGCLLLRGGRERACRHF